MYQIYVENSTYFRTTPSLKRPFDSVLESTQSSLGLREYQSFVLGEKFSSKSSPLTFHTMMEPKPNLKEQGEQLW